MTNAEIEERVKISMCPTCIHIDECDITACGRRNTLFDAIDAAKNVKKMLIEEASEWLKQNTPWTKLYCDERTVVGDFRKTMDESSDWLKQKYDLGELYRDEQTVIGDLKKALEE